MSTQTILAEIETEREYQDQKWGHAFDDENTPHEWVAYIAHYAARHLAGNPAGVDVDKFRLDMVKVAALAVAAIEAVDRKAA